MKNIHVLSTDEPSRLFNCFGKLGIGDYVATRENLQVTNQHIYITSDEDIKEGDWFYNTISLKPEPFKACENGDGYVNCSKYSHYRIDCKKIILTTDQDLIKDGVQAIDDDFLEWFIKNTSCEYVGVKKGFADGTAYGYNFLDYKIIIPKEEKCTCKEHDPYCCQIHGNCPTCVKKEELKQENCCTPLGQIKRYEDCYGCDRKPKQEKLTYTESAKKEERISNSIMMKRKKETLEEVAKRYAIQVYKGKIVYHGFIDGVKWMQERMYSEKEVESLLHKYMQSQIPDWHGWSTTKWFEQFKKK